ncbi:TetR/AcrR family transcriptional regulator [Tersicoccus sp. MR15.9]|uniref:TetR/AcrR family transcriptional regulator n=1 Tax=Tersicoccus mangrovi TaxID=3121635 RepID=UPI002FE54425
MPETTPDETREPARATARGASRRGRPGYDQQTVLRIAVDVFNRHGYEATSMGVLADELGISKSAIYHHVPGKEDLLRLALERALGGLESTLHQPGATTGTADERLEFVVRGTVAVLVDELPFVTLLLRLRGNTEMERQALERRRYFDRQIAVLVEQASKEGSVRSDIAPRVASRLLFGTINSIVEWYRPGGSLSQEELADDVVAILFDGLHEGRRSAENADATGLVGL